MKSPRVLTVIGMAVAVPFLFLGCGSDEGTTAGGMPDTDPPMVAQITVIDGQHVDVTFNETVQKATAERQMNYLIVEQMPSPVAGRRDDNGDPSLTAPGDTVTVGTAVRKANGKTVALSLVMPMNNAPYDINVTGVRDLNGNEIMLTQSVSFTGTNTPDTTPPTIISRTPAPGATGVGIAQSVVIEFSEGMNQNSVVSAFDWTWSGGSVGFVANWENNNVVAFSPVQQLMTNTLYTASLASTATDAASNPIAATDWTFRTMMMADITRPTFVSSVPANGATNVPKDVVLRLTFSEPIDPNSFNDEGASILLVPDPGDGLLTWTNGGRTLNFEPFSPLLDNQQYTLTIPEGAVADFAGNPLEGSTVIAFTTGASLPTGAIMGRVAGDPTSLDATDPEGAIVIASSNNFIGNDEDPLIQGAAIAGNEGVYSIANLPDGCYFPAAFMESNGDGVIDPGFGDAFGAFGVDIANMDFMPDSAEIAGGATVTNIDFPLYDQIAIGGNVVYVGTAHDVNETPWFYVGIFDTTGFDVSLGPDYSPGSRSIVDDPTFQVDELGDELVDGTYYVGAYLDANSNAMYDAETDPIGFYDDELGNPIPVTVENGRDAIGLVVEIEDAPVQPSASAVLAWKGRAKPRTLTGEAAAVREYYRFMMALYDRHKGSP